jgi:YhcH/YjgK/YiaL family protein
MIHDLLANASLYAAVHPKFAMAIEYLQSDLSHLPPGRYELPGGCFALVQEYEPQPVDEWIFETHRKYIDVQFMAAGEEYIYFSPAEDLEAGEYQPEKDYRPLRGSGLPVRLKAGEIAIFFPHDAHLPARQAPAGGAVRKIVVKVAVE